MKKLLQTIAAVVLAASMVPTYAIEVDGENDKQPSRISQLINLGGAICSGAAAAFLGKWAVTTMINDHTLYAVRAEKADALFQGWLDLISKGTFQLTDSEYRYGSQQLNIDHLGLQQLKIDRESALTLEENLTITGKVFEQLNQIPAIGLIPRKHSFFEAARTAAGNWHITIPAVFIATIIGATSVGYIYDHFFKDKSREKDGSTYPDFEYLS